MRLLGERKEKRKYICSSLFMLMLILFAYSLEIKDGCIAVVLTALPIVSVILIKILSFLWEMSKEEKDIYLELTEDKICYSLKKGSVEEIPFSDIRDIQVDDEVLHIFVDESVEVKESKLRKIFRYYIENLEHVVHIPNLWNKKELDIFFNEMKSKLIITPVKEDLDAFAGLCGAYLCILIGTFWFFFLQAAWDCSLEINLLKLLIVFIVIIVMHFYNKNSLYTSHFNIGSCLRCFVTSLFTAQYILCACQIEEIVKSTNMELISSWQSVTIIGLIYFLTCVLYFPQKGLGRKMTLYVIKKRNMSTNKEM